MAKFKNKKQILDELSAIADLLKNMSSGGEGNGSSDDNNDSDSNDKDKQDKNQENNSEDLKDKDNKGNSGGSNGSDNNENDGDLGEDGNDSNNNGGDDGDDTSEEQNKINDINDKLQGKEGSESQQGTDGNSGGNSKSGKGKNGQGKGGGQGQGGSGTGSGGGNGGQNGRGQDSNGDYVIFRGKKIYFGDAVDVRTNDENANETEKNLQRRQIQATRSAISELRGYANAGTCAIVNIFEQEVKPTPPSWVKLLNKYLRPDHNVEFLWRKAHQNRVTRLNQGRVLMRGINRPPEKLKDLAIGIDNSGSISDADFESFYSIMEGFLRVRNNVEGKVYFWNTEVSNAVDFKDAESAREALKQNIGGGGTDPECFFKKALEENKRYVIVFTDGEFPLPHPDWADKFDCIVWALTGPIEYDSFMKMNPYGEVSVNKQDKSV